MQNLRWKLITVATVFVVFAAVGVYPMVAARFGITWPGWLLDRQLKLGQQHQKLRHPRPRSQKLPPPQNNLVLSRGSNWPTLRKNRSTKAIRQKPPGYCNRPWT